MLYLSVFSLMSSTRARINNSLWDLFTEYPVSDKVLSLQIWWDSVLTYLHNALLTKIICLVPRVIPVNSFLGTVKCAIFNGHTFALLDIKKLLLGLTKYTTVPIALSLLSVNAWSDSLPWRSNPIQHGIGITKASF